MKLFLHLAKEEIQRDIRLRIFHAILGFVLFIILGYYSPRLYIEYLDKTDYVTITQPVPLEKGTYRQCDTVNLLANINAKLTTTARVSIQLIDASDKNLKPLQTFEGRYVFIEGRSLEIGEVYLGAFDPSCNRKPGIYLFRGVITYEYKGSMRSYSYITSTFRLLPKDYPPTEDENILEDLKENGGELYD